jgi:hypothetical protein
MKTTTYSDRETTKYSVRDMRKLKKNLLKRLRALETKFSPGGRLAIAEFREKLNTL